MFSSWLTDHKAAYFFYILAVDPTDDEILQTLLIYSFKENFEIILVSDLI